MSIVGEMILKNLMEMKCSKIFKLMISHSKGEMFKYKIYDKYFYIIYIFSILNLIYINIL